MPADAMNNDKARAHAIDRLLAEELGGVRPPDLEARILAAANRRTIDLPEVVAEPNPRRNRSVLLSSMVIGAAVAAAVLSWIGPPRIESPVATPQLIAEVPHGRLEWRSEFEPTVVAQNGQSMLVRPAVGDRLLTAPSEPTQLILNPLGTLHCTPGTILEVQNMEWKEFGGGLAAGALTVSILVGATHWLGDGDSAHAETGETLVMHNTLGARGEMIGENSDLEKQLADAKKRIGELEEAVARKPQPPTESRQPKPEPTFDPILSESTYADALRELSWKTVGEAVFGYFGTQREIMELMARGEEVPTALNAAEERWESMLIAEIGEALDTADIPGTNMTAKIHHPAMGINLVVAALTKAGVPVSAEQRKAMLHLTNQFTSEDKIRWLGYSEDEFALERQVSEAEMSGRYFKQLRGLLTADQEKLFALNLADRTRTDPLGSGYMWSRMDRVIVADNREDLASRAGRGYAQDLSLTKSQVDKLRPIVSDWAKKLPAKWLDLPMDHCDRRGSHHIPRVRTMARAQLELMRRMARDLGLDADQIRILRKLNTVFLPFIRQR